MFFRLDFLLLDYIHAHINTKQNRISSNYYYYYCIFIYFYVVVRICATNKKKERFIYLFKGKYYIIFIISFHSLLFSLKIFHSLPFACFPFFSCCHYYLSSSRVYFCFCFIFIYKIIVTECHLQTKLENSKESEETQVKKTKKKELNFSIVDKSLTFNNPFFLCCFFFFS